MSQNQFIDPFDLEAPVTYSDMSLQPLTFGEFVGQEKVCQRLELMVEAAKLRSDVLEHVLLTGPPGLGKTTLAYILANSMGVNIKTSSGPMIRAGDLAGILTTLEHGDIIFIDEIHRLQPEIEEYLYPAMEDFRLDIVIDQERSVRLDFPKFTLIGAAPGTGSISKQLFSRFGTSFEVSYYTPGELERIVTRSAAIIGVPIDASSAGEIAARSRGTPRIANNLLRVAAPRLRLASAFKRSGGYEIPNAIATELWTLAEARPDFEELPDWVIQGEAATNAVEGSRREATALEQSQAILRSVADRYGDEADREALLKSNFLQGGGGGGANLENFAPLLADALQQAAGFRKGVRRLSLAIHESEILLGRHTRVSFNRTLRVPEDAREYPLPAGLGRLPILRVEDYPDRVPEKWLTEGGFIIPLFQREALFLEFSGAAWRPTIGKVAVGGVNAISGRDYDLAIRPHRQDYIVIPDQRWLDGINSARGSVSQFVAMPLGEGYTIEAQITDEEKHGGFQLVIFDPKPGRFSEENPSEKEAALKARKQRSLLGGLPEATAEIFRALQKHHCSEAARLLGISEEEIRRIVAAERTHFESLLGPYGFDGVIPPGNLADLRTKYPQVGFMPMGPSRPVEMGIGAGGRIKQQIVEDLYGAESWDEAAFREVPIHIVNSAVYKEITGLEPPPSPITVEHYQRCGIPWYSDYKERIPIISPAGILKRILTIGHIDKSRGVKGMDEPQHRGVKGMDEPQHREIRPEEILRIRIQTLQERVTSLVQRAQQSLKHGSYRIAAREASLALDIVKNDPLLFLIRAHANLSLGFYSDAEVDSSACLKLQPNNLYAFTIRSFSSLALGETVLAKNDADKILEFNPTDKDALFVRAKANLQMMNFAEALADAEKILHQDDSHVEALRIQSEALTALSKGTPK